MNAMVLGFALLLHGLSAQNEISPVMYFTEDRLPVDGDFKSVYEIDVEERTARVIYTSELGVRDVVCAKQSERLIVHATNYETGETEVHIINRNGDVVEKFQDGVSAVFVDAAGNTMIYTRGELNKNLLTESRGTWLRDLNTGEERMIAETGLYLELAKFKQSIYARGGGPMGFVYSITTEHIEFLRVYTGGYSPEGTYRWSYESTPIPIDRCATGEVVSTEFELIQSRQHGTPFYWMNDRVLMVPHGGKGIEDYLLFVETGKTLKAPGRILSITRDEKYVFVCKPGLVIEKVAMGDLEVLYEGKGELSPADAEEPTDVE